METICLILLLLLLKVLFSYEGKQQSHHEEMEFVDEDFTSINHKK